MIQKICEKPYRYGYYTETPFQWLSAYAGWLYARVVGLRPAKHGFAALLAAGVDARHLYEDRASGANDGHSGLTHALEFVRPGDVLVVWKLDRLGRSLSHLLAIVNMLKDKHVSFRSLTEGMDTTTTSGELLFHVLGALAQYERPLIQERVIAGLAAAKRRGWIGSRPAAIVGEKRDAIIAALNGGYVEGRCVPQLRRQAHHLDRNPGPDRLDRIA